MPKHPNTELSQFVNDAMDYLGYSKEKIKSRAADFKYLTERQYDILSKVNPQFNGQIDVIPTGSRSEGVVQLLESDKDMMFVYRSFLCADSGRIENDLAVIQTHMTESPPGYTQLIPLNINSGVIGVDTLASSTVYDLTAGHNLLSSTCVRNWYSERMTDDVLPYAGVQFQSRPNSGPSAPISVNVGAGGICTQLNIPTLSLDVDRVFAMPYFTSTILQIWKKRSRTHNWPPRDVIQEISTMEGFVVPVGPKYSEKQNLEWRICYTTAELKLVSHFSAVQLKLYILMKMIFKQIIGPKCDLITSYMVKNTVFWVCEGNAAAVFTRDKLLDLLLQSLVFLLQCLHSNFLPNYMIPGRNLLLGKGNHQDNLILHRTLRHLLNKGGAIVLMIQKLGTVTNFVMTSPMLGQAYGNYRDKVEDHVQLLMQIHAHKLSPELIFRHSLLYDLHTECLKDPLFIRVLLSLLKLLNVNLRNQDIFNLLKTLLSS